MHFLAYLHFAQLALQFHHQPISWLACPSYSLGDGIETSSEYPSLDGLQSDHSANLVFDDPIPLTLRAPFQFLLAVEEEAK